MKKYTEEIHVVIKVSQKELPVGLMRKLIKHFSRSTFRDGDTFELDYNFNIDYIGDIEKSMNLILQMLNENSDVLKEVNLVEVQHGRCLIGELFERFKELENVALSR